MRASVHQYLYGDTSFRLFGADHLWGIVVSVLFIIIVPWISVKYLNKRAQKYLGMIIGYIVMLNYPAWVILESIAGSFDVLLHLPVHLCRLSNLLIPLVMIKRHFLTFEILFFGALVALCRERSRRTFLPASLIFIISGFGLDTRALFLPLSMLWLYLK